MASKGIEVKVASSGGKEVDDVTSFEGCIHKIIPFTRSISPIWDLITLIRLYFWIRKEQFDIVHSHTPKAGLLTMIASYLAGVPVRVHTIAGIPWMESKGAKRTLLKLVDKLAYCCATDVFPNSRELEKFILRHRLVSKAKIKVIGQGSSNGIDTLFFSPSSLDETKNELRIKYKIPVENFVFVFVGRIVKDKGMNELAEAFKLFNGSAHLVVVGPLEQELDPIKESTLEFFKASENVSFMGYQEDVRPFLKLSDALVFPSYREGFPNVPMQAGAMGLPSIVSDINGCNEIILEGQNGLLIEPKNSEMLLNAMLKLSTDERLYQHLARQSQTLVRSRFSQKVVWDALYEEYIALAEKNLDV